MTNRIALIAVSLLLITAGACTSGSENGADSRLSLAVVDSNQVMLQSSPGVQAMEYLRGLSTQLQEDLQGMQDSMSGNQTEEDSMAFQEKFAASQARMGEEQNRIIAVINNEYEQVLADYRTANSIDVILTKEAAISFGETVDITDEIIAAMDELQIDFATAKAPETALDGGMLGEQ